MTRRPSRRSRPKSFIAVAAWLPRRRDVVTDLVMVGCGAGLVGLTMICAVFAAVP